MSTTINLSGANTYFGNKNHIQYAVWTAFGSEQQERAINQAIRELSRSLGSAIVDETVDSDDYYQPDYAAYEQALYILKNSDAIADGTKTGPKHIATDAQGEPREASGMTICKEARRWMGWSTGAPFKFFRG